MADIRNTGTWQRVERGLTEMANLHSRGEYNLALVKGRQTMEQIVRLYAGQSFVVYTDLADTIENLYQGRYIGKDTRDAFHMIRLLGNKAVHEGDNEPQDAERSYRLLEQEIRRFAGGNAQQRGAAVREADTSDRESGEQDGTVKKERTRVPVEGPRRSTEGRRRYDKLDDRSARDTKKVPTREDRLRAQRSGRGKSGSGRKQRQSSAGGVNVYDVLRILIPVICIILLVVLIRSIFFSGSTTEPESTTPVESQTELETEPETIAPPETEPETTVAAVLTYRIKGNAVNVRYADNENRVYTQLANGTEIGEATPVEGTDKMQFTLDGIAVTVNRNYIEAVEPAAPSAQETVNPLAETTAQ